MAIAFGGVWVPFNSQFCSRSCLSNDALVVLSMGLHRQDSYADWHSVSLLAQIEMEHIFRMILCHLCEAGLLPAAEQSKMDMTISTLIRLRSVK
jgi:hypothetical protein